MPFTDLTARLGKTYTSDWLVLDQDRIDRFAEVTGDHQFIHTDPERARAETPFGGTIAHGFLTLSCLAGLTDCLPPVPGKRMGINYGFDKLRFLTPVREGERVRAHFTVAEVSERKPGEALVHYDVSVEIEGADKPALAARWLSLTLFD
ncbi:MAG: MaoC family dehydratase [Alphaproteobacteria bacterium]|nr:MaoC family dehydratase [Alphaproteobacteria bacterium]